MNTSCEKCRALEFVNSGIRRGHIISFKLYEPRYNCALGEKIVLIEGRPHCNGDCKNKTTRILKSNIKEIEK